LAEETRENFTGRYKENMFKQQHVSKNRRNDVARQFGGKGRAYHGSTSQLRGIPHEERTREKGGGSSWKVIVQGSGGRTVCAQRTTELIGPDLTHQGKHKGWRMTSARLKIWLITTGPKVIKNSARDNIGKKRRGRQELEPPTTWTLMFVTRRSKQQRSGRPVYKLGLNFFESVRSRKKLMLFGQSVH